MKKKNLVVLTGAGMSAESGILTFRDTGGLWDKYHIDDVATPHGWFKNPALVMDFYNQRRNQLLEVSPNEGHNILASLESHFNVQIITQNVDDLHERAGSKNILHLHGELTKVRSTSPTAEVFDLSTDKYQINYGEMCPKGYQLRPHIVWFGEDVPEIEHAIELVKKADMFLVIGTSLQVYPAAGLLEYIPPKVPIVAIDPNELNIDKPNLTIISKGAGEGMKDFIALFVK